MEQVTLAEKQAQEIREQARRDARQAAEQMQHKIGQILDQARSTARQEAIRMLQDAEAEATTETEELMARTDQQCSELRAAAAAHMGEAVQSIIERVVDV